ncbi:restriction endonuclease subunit S [Alistipes finegoldii]|uniref:restriction endonuclease subunit S n=1 Tax=Alistipes finegoldii TaxID=214856 RepID=UPI001D08775C|nr:restriction endonuclease subunit S [Alistipes finegoldii]MCB6684079.1 restriction endonuclease subunit S [Alistipes finegoldii]
MATNNNDKTLNVPHLRFPEFSGEWYSYPLTDFMSFKNGMNPDAKRFGRGIKFISVMDILNNQFICYDNIRASVEVIEGDIETYGVNYGDILFQRSSETLEDVGQANVYLDRKPAVFGGFVIRGKSKGNYHPVFFRYLLASPTARKRIIVKGAGAQHFNIGQDGLSRVCLNIPSIQEQEKIAKLFECVDTRIATQNKIIEKYESLIKGLNNILLYGTGGKSVCLGDILLERSERSRTNNQHEVLSSTVKGIFSQREYFSKDIASENNVGYKIIRLHDVVLSPQNLWMGNINYNDRFEIGIVSPSYKVFSIADGYDNQFVAAMLKTHRALYSYMMVSEQGASIVRRNLNMEAFSQLVFKIPSLDKQREIGCAISLLKSQLKTANKLIRAYTSQKQYLLRQMFI